MRNSEFISYKNNQLQQTVIDGERISYVLHFIVLPGHPVLCRKFCGWKTVKPCPHCHRKRRLSQKVRLSQKMVTVAENGEKTATVALFCDSRRFRRQIVADF